MEMLRQQSQDYARQATERLQRKLLAMGLQQMILPGILYYDTFLEKLQQGSQEHWIICLHSANTVIMPC